MENDDLTEQKQSIPSLNQLDVLYSPKSGCGGRFTTTIPASAPPGFPATPIVCNGGLKSCHWYVLLYSEFNCKDKKGFGSVSFTGILALKLLW